MDTIAYATCFNCKKTKPTSEFHLRTDGKPVSRCKPCRKKYDQLRAKHAIPRKLPQRPLKLEIADRHDYLKILHAI